MYYAIIITIAIISVLIVKAIEQRKRWALYAELTAMEKEKDYYESMSKKLANLMNIDYQNTKEIEKQLNLYKKGYEGIRRLYDERGDNNGK